MEREKGDRPDGVPVLAFHGFRAGKRSGLHFNVLNRTAQ
jgi:hypothetical protein